jgi:hypothetical protein
MEALFFSCSHHGKAVTLEPRVAPKLSKDHREDSADQCLGFLQ